MVIIYNVCKLMDAHSLVWSFITFSFNVQICSLLKIPKHTKSIPKQTESNSQLKVLKIKQFIAFHFPSINAFKHMDYIF